MTIKTHIESSKTELSSRGKRPFKVKKSESLVGSFWFLINPMHCTLTADSGTCLLATTNDAATTKITIVKSFFFGLGVDTLISSDAFQ